MYSNLIFLINYNLFIVGYGVSSDGEIIFINASTCNLKYSPRNPPVVFDITLPADVEKT